MTQVTPETLGPAKDSDGLGTAIPAQEVSCEIANAVPELLDATANDSSESTDLGDYSSMFREYVAGQAWIGPADMPLVFHLRKLCQQLDANPDAPAAVSSAYLQAFSRLDRRRPGAQVPGDGLRPVGDQPSIFDAMDD